MTQNLGHAEQVKAAMLALRERPRDEGLRQVLADVLLDAGDPRGEYLSLSRMVAAQQNSGAVRHRAEELLRQHRTTWLSDLEGALVDVKFEGGFASRAMVAPVCSNEQFRSAVTSFSACTMTHLAVRRRRVDAVAVVEHMPLVESLQLDDQTFVLAGAFASRLVSLDTTWLLDRPFPALRKLVLRAMTQPQLASLGHAVKLEALEQVVVVEGRRMWGPVLRAWEKMPCPRLSCPPSLECRRWPDGSVTAELLGVGDTELRSFARAAPRGLRAVTLIGAVGSRMAQEARAMLPGVSVDVVRL